MTRRLYPSAVSDVKGAFLGLYLSLQPPKWRTRRWGGVSLTRPAAEPVTAAA